MKVSSHEELVVVYHMAGIDDLTSSLFACSHMSMSIPPVMSSTHREISPPIPIF